MGGIKGNVRDEQTFPGCTDGRIALSKVEQEPFHGQLGLIENVEMKRIALG